MDGSLTSLEVLAAAEHALLSGGYSRIEEDDTASKWRRGRGYEDEYGIVGVFVYDSVADLDSLWSEAQDAVVDLITRYIGRDEAKAWDGYLCLMTPAVAEPALLSRMADIRRNTSRLRKLVATGCELKSVSDILRSLQALLPLEPQVAADVNTSALDALPGILLDHGISTAATVRLIEAFEQQDSMMRALQEVAVR